ncbi:MAG: hypothetical protein ACUZ8N_10945 [Candidatus Scalindua sp.]
METKLTVKKARFLFNVEKALKQMPSTSTVESTTVDNVILRDLVMLENIASSGSVFLTADLDTDVNQSSGEGFIVLESPMTFAYSMN